MKRLHVVIAEAGLASRRSAEQLIRDGHVWVNGSVVRTQGFKIDPDHDQVEVRGQRLSRAPEVKRYYVFHKPRGVVTTLKDPHATRSVADFFRDIPERLFPVGRLDKDSSGLLLMTNDGNLANRLTHPRYGSRKRYRVVVSKSLSEEQLNRLRRGVVLDGKKTAPCQIQVSKESGKGQQSELMFTLHEGKKRQIRRMIKIAGASVLTLHRESLSFLSIGNLGPGEKRSLTDGEIKALKKSAIE